MSRNKLASSTYRLTNRAKEIMNKVQEVEDLTNRTQTLEFLLRDYIKLRGIKLNDSDS